MNATKSNKHPQDRLVLRDTSGHQIGVCDAALGEYLLANGCAQRYGSRRKTRGLVLRVPLTTIEQICGMPSTPGQRVTNRSYVFREAVGKSQVFCLRRVEHRDERGNIVATESGRDALTRMCGLPSKDLSQPTPGCK